MTLGELIERLQDLDPAMVCSPGFGEGGSWRGSYEEVAFNPVATTTVGAMLTEAEAMIGATIHGWKGGDFFVTRSTQCNVAAPGNYGGDSDRMGVWWATHIGAQSRVKELEADLANERKRLAKFRRQRNAARKLFTTLVEAWPDEAREDPALIAARATAREWLEGDK